MKSKIIYILLSLVVYLCTANAQKPSVLGNHHAIMHMVKSGKYLLLPIEEQAQGCHIRLLSKNKEVKNFNVRLAVNRVDYVVPVDLSELSCPEFLIDVDFWNKNYSVDELGGLMCWKEIKQADKFDTANREKYRPEFHHTPSYGWMNDPNGMFYKDGVWHLYFQWNPYGSYWENMNWGHATSTDLINWENKGLAIAPDALGTIFSGSCVVDKDNTAGFGKNAVIAMYTSAGENQTQSLAYSLDDGMTFTKYDGNPVLTADIPDFRDPSIFWYEPTNRWILIMSAGQEMRIYSSYNLKEWSEESRFGLGYGNHDGVWECPAFMKLKVENGSRKGKEYWVLVCNINPGGPAGGSATQYFVGNFDGHKFTPLEGNALKSESLWQDYGKDHYAAVSFSNAPDNRHTMIAWMSNWQYADDVPTMQYRAANTICREPFLYEGEKVNGKKNSSLYLGSRPSPEYTGKGLDKTISVKGSCDITLNNAEGEEFVISYDQEKMTLSIDRSKSGEVGFSKDFVVPVIAPVHRKLISMRIFIDNSSVEVFGNNGEVCITSQVFPKSKYNKLSIKKR